MKFLKSGRKFQNFKKFLKILNKFSQIPAVLGRRPRSSLRSCSQPGPARLWRAWLSLSRAFRAKPCLIIITASEASLAKPRAKPWVCTGCERSELGEASNSTGASEASGAKRLCGGPSLWLLGRGRSEKLFSRCGEPKNFPNHRSAREPRPTSRASALKAE